MLFNSYEFIFAFLPLSFFIYFYLLHKRLIIGAKAFLVFSSLFFYSWWNIAYLPLILSSMLFNYALGNTLNYDPKKLKISKKTILAFGIIANVALLSYFKYSDFFLENINLLFGADIPLLHLALPLAISFFTFQQIAYLVDSYRGETKEYDFLNYALFVTFFPQLIAGPIVHHKEMMPQFASRWNLIKRYKNIAAGLFIFSIGLFKKVVIADSFSVWVNAGFNASDSLNIIEAWATSLSYTFQLYFDFSGYTDMAIGAALLFNIKLPINFNSPYKALDIQDFWRRWHITLSRFLKEYIYIPLGGNRKGRFRTYANLLLTFLIGGIWHGAGWTFVLWGLLHGLALVIHRVWHSLGFRLNKIVAWFITFNFINITWVFFRAKDFQEALNVLYSMFFGKLIIDYHLREKLHLFSDDCFGPWLQHINATNDIFLWIFITFTLLFTKNSIEYMRSFKPTKLNLLFISLITIYALLDMNKVSEFIYFNF